MNHNKLLSLIKKYKKAKNNGQLQNASEATMRTWIDEFLSLFGWDVQNTHQVLTEHSLSSSERARLREIGSTNTRPDYTLVNGRVKLAFVDAKNLSVDIENDKEAAFQIRSYGWSIGASFSIVTNFDQLAIYDCTVMPNVEDDASFARVYLFNYEQYLEMSDILESLLSRDNVVSGNSQLIHDKRKGDTLDEKFSAMLREIRKELAKAILKNNRIDNTRTLSYYVQTIINRVLFIRVCESRNLEVEGLLRQFANQGFWDAFKASSYAGFYEHYDGPLFKRIQSLQTLTIDNGVFERFLRHLYYPSPYRFDVIPLNTLSDIYDLFLGYELHIEGENVIDALRPEFQKTNGAVPTPASTHTRHAPLGQALVELLADRGSAEAKHCL